MFYFPCWVSIGAAFGNSLFLISCTTNYENPLAQKDGWEQTWNNLKKKKS